MQWPQRMVVSLFSRTTYQEVSQDEDQKSYWHNGLRDIVGPKQFRLKLCAICLILMILLVMRASKPDFAKNQTPQITAQFLHVLIPASQKNVNLCKTVVSAGALNYPTPILLNWGVEFNSSNPVGGGSQLAKVAGALDYINTLPPERNGDLVLVLDGVNDVWMQLRPGVLIERYFDINRRATARIHTRLGQKAMENDKIGQRILFLAQKSCWPREEGSPGCSAVPDSPLPRDVYGLETDMDIGNEKNPYVKFRPRHLNFGVGMGDVASLRSLLSHALEKMTVDGNFGSAQDVFAQIFEEQEYQREVIRRQDMGMVQRVGRLLKSFIVKESSVLASLPTQRLLELADCPSSEFGIGLDYEGLLGHTTMYAEMESEWIRHNDTEVIAEASKKQNISPVKVSRVPEDIKRSLTPFWSANGARDGLPQNLDWENVPLYTNLWTGNVPAIIHQNTNNEDAKDAWKRTWFRSHARKLLDVYINEPYRPVATLRDAGHEVAYWSEAFNKWEFGTTNEEQQWIQWEEVCGDYQEEIFGDGKGIWRPPRVDY